MSNDLSAKSESIKSTALLFFAFVGFVASFITVVEFLRPKSNTSLDVQAQIHDFRVPLYVAANLKNDSAARILARELKKRACQTVQVPGIASISYADLGKIDLSEAELDKALKCKDAIDVEYAARWAGIYGSGYSTLYEYEIQNTGTEIAKQIRLSSENVLAIQFRRDALKFFDLPKSEDESFYNIPDLNPGEKINLLIWSDDYHSDVKYVSDNDLPKLSFSGSRVNISLFLPVPYEVYGFYSAYEDMPIWLFFIFFVAMCFIVTMAVIFVFSIAEAVLRGKPLSSIFETTTKSQGSEGASPT